MADGGWVKIYRKIRQSFVWTDPRQLKLWLLVLMKASHSGHRFLFNGQEVSVSSGQFVTGRDTLAFEYNEGAKRDQRIVARTLWRWMKQFENSQMLSIKSTPQYSVVTVLHWSEYQESDQQLSNARPSTDQHLSTIKNVKNEQEKTVPTTGAVQALSFYEQNFGVMPPVLQQGISDWVGDFEEIGATTEQANQILVKGMQIALDRNKRSFGYVKGILRDWEGKKLTSVQAIEGEEARFKAQKQSTRQNGNQAPQPPPPGYEYSDDDLPF